MRPSLGTLSAACVSLCVLTAMTSAGLADCGPPPSDPPKGCKAEPSAAAEKPGTLSKICGPAEAAWRNLSGLAAHPTDPDILFAVTDKDSLSPRILTIDVSREVPYIVGVTEISGIGAALDLEGIVAKKDGGFWLVSEGAAGDDPPNLVLEVDSSGRCLRSFGLPEDLGGTGARSDLDRFGFEGIALDETDPEAPILYVALQKPLTTDPVTDGKADTRIGKLNPKTGAWSFYRFPLQRYDRYGDKDPDKTEKEKTNTGLSELTRLGANRFAVIERDGLKNDAPDIIKDIEIFDLPADGADAPIEVSESIDLSPYFDAGTVPEQIEGPGGHHRWPHVRRDRRGRERRYAAPTGGGKARPPLSAGIAKSAASRPPGPTGLPPICGKMCRSSGSSGLNFSAATFKRSCAPCSLHSPRA